MYTYTFEWKHGGGTSLVTKMVSRLTTPRIKAHSERVIIGFGKAPSIIVRGLGSDDAVVHMSQIPLKHLEAITAEIRALSALHGERSLKGD